MGIDCSSATNLNISMSQSTGSFRGDPTSERGVDSLTILIEVFNWCTGAPIKYRTLTEWYKGADRQSILSNKECTRSKFVKESGPSKPTSKEIVLKSFAPIYLNSNLIFACLAERLGYQQAPGVRLQINTLHRWTQEGRTGSNQNAQLGI